MSDKGKAQVELKRKLGIWFFKFPTVKGIRKSIQNSVTNTDNLIHTLVQIYPLSSYFDGA